MTKLTDTNHTDTKNTPTQTICPHTMPYDLAAKSLSTCIGDTLGADHPAADLDAMSNALVSVLIDENDGEKLLRRQTQVLDAAFHTLLTKGLAPDEPERLPLIALALRAQKQAEETLGRAHMMPYTRVMQEHIANKPSETLADLIIKREKRRPAALDDVLSKQTGFGENDS